MKQEDESDKLLLLVISIGGGSMDKNNRIKGDIYGVHTIIR